MVSAILRHTSQNDFIQSLRLTSQRADAGIFVLDINDISDEAAATMELYRNEFYEINLVRDQYDFKFTIDDRTYHPQGEAYITFIPPSQLQSYEVLGDDPKASGYIIYINKESLRSMNLGEEFPLFKRHRDNFFKLSEEQSEELFELVKTMLAEFRSHTKHSAEILQSFARILLLKSSNLISTEDDETKHDQKLIARFESMVNQQYIRHKSVQYYANELAISMRQLSNITRQAIGKSPLQIIHDVILNESKALLSHSKMTTSEVAYTLGFEEVANFSRFFKKHTSITPSDYRKSTELDKTFS